MELTQSQQRMLSEYRQIIYNKQLDEIDRRAQKALAAEYPNESKKTCMLKIRVIDARKPGQKSAIVSVWRPNETNLQMLREGQFCEMKCATVSGSRFDELEISTTPRTIFQMQSGLDILPEHLHWSRIFTPIGDIRPLAFCASVQ